MNVKLRFASVMFGLLVMGNAQAGFIVANMDEWTLSDTGFNNAPDTTNFINNVTNLFSGDQPGDFLAYSNNFGLTQNSLANAVTGAGHSWTVDTSSTFNLSTLNQYDGVFLGGSPTGLDQQVVIDYLDGGGNVYIMAGTGSYGGPAPEAAAWNDVLSEAGLSFASSWCCNNVVATPDDSSHPLLDGVSSLFFDYGNAISDLDTAGTDGEILFSFNGQGMLAMGTFGDLPAPSVYSPVPGPASLFLFGLGLILMRLKQST